ncbi:MAG TPA: tRNA pseudouridine(55) synthase TruB [Candidatus Polarisedimenticolia bacterium]|nr:tRNA pseudouridine(55) synthase TruB [Candidatus Polarisedimenticolia bacterium]
MTPIEGVLLVDKPEGPTSHDVVAVARRALGEKRIGHAGTLDPLATGLLVLMIGRATRLASVLSGVDKTYRGVVRLGFATDTYDRAGQPDGPPREVRVERAAIEALLDRFRGRVAQTPPVFSAKKVQGTPMYRLARRHRPVTPVPTMVTFKRLDLLGFDGTNLEIEAEVSAGTYLRSFAHDLGVALGCGGHLHSLRRMSAGPFRVEDAMTLDELTRLGRDTVARLLTLDDVPLGMPTVRLTAAGAHAVRHGRPCGPADVMTPPPLPPGRCRLQGPEGRLVAIAEVVVASPEIRPLIRPQIVFSR